MVRPRRGKRANDPEEPQESNKGEGYIQVEIGGDNVTFEWLKNNLTTRMQEQEATRALLPDLIREKNGLLKQGNTTALNNWRRRRGKNKVTREFRKKEKDDFMNAQALLEDFLYFQNHSHRRNRNYEFKVDKKPGHSRLSAVGLGNRQNILDAFDKAKIGGPVHRSGFSDWEGKEIRERESGQGPKPVRFNELHLWTPACRRVPVGFAATKDMSVEATALVLDIDNIREEWKRIEEVEIPERGQEGFPYRTHMERRQQEQALYRSELGNLRPTTAGLHLETTPDGVKLQDRFRDMQILDGVFISALESSYDWRTSYDLLGPVKSGIYANFTVSDERETIDEEPAEDSLENDDNITEQPEPSKKRKATGKTKSCTKKKPKNDATEDQTTEHTTAEQQPTTDNRTMLDCPYPAGEFQQPSSKRPLTLSTPLVSTPWCEETPGRREYHVSLLLSPSSAVDSPPHTPIPHPTAASLPASFPNDEVSPIGLAAQRRCAHEPERCRAWWSHAADACWIVESEAAGRRSPVVHPIAEIEGPGEEEFVLPEGARAVYGERVADQYGVMGEAWPRVGVRVPYEPMGWDDVRVGGRRDGGEEEGERARNVVHEYRAMAAPLIPLEERVGGVNADADADADAGNGVGYESDGSDYEGDMFRSMYSLGRIGITTRASESRMSQAESAAES